MERVREVRRLIRDLLEQAQAGLWPGRSPCNCVCLCRCPSELQSLLLQPQLPHPVSVLT